MWLPRFQKSHQNMPICICANAIILRQCLWLLRLRLGTLILRRAHDSGPNEHRNPTLQTNRSQITRWPLVAGDPRPWLEPDAETADGAPRRGRVRVRSGPRAGGSRCEVSPFILLVPSRIRTVPRTGYRLQYAARARERTSPLDPGARAGPRRAESWRVFGSGSGFAHPPTRRCD